MIFSNRHTLLKTVVMVVSSAIVISGCALTSSSSEKSVSPSQPEKTMETTALYYDFEDVLLPKDLKIIDDGTVVVSTPGYTSGIMTFKGRIKKESLFSFFMVNMLKDNWNSVSHIKSPNSTIMIFQKASRWAVITIREKTIYTYVEIGVAPTLTKES